MQFFPAPSARETPEACWHVYCRLLAAWLRLLTVHNQSPSRKASTLSVGRKRLVLTLGA